MFFITQLYNTIVIYSTSVEKMAKDGVTLIDMKSEDNKYLHRDFHISADNALKYCGDDILYVLPL